MVGKLKRKSEGDLPNTRSNTRKNDSFKSDEDHEEDSSAITDGYKMMSLKRGGKDKREREREREKEKEKEKKKGRNSEAVRISGREVSEMGELGEDEDEDEDDDEFYEDPGRQESKEFLELDNLERKKKKNAERAKALFMEKFVGIVERDAEGFRKLIGEAEQRFSIQNKEFLKGLHAAYVLSAPFKVLKPDAKHDKDFYEFALMHKKGEDLIGQAREVVSQFDKLAEMHVAKEFEGLVGNKWEKGDGGMAKMLELGKMVGLNKFECVMNASKPGDLEIEEVKVSKKFYSVDDEGEGDTIGWGKEAKKQERANRKLLKTFEGRA